MPDVTIEALNQGDYKGLKTFLEASEYPNYIHVNPLFFDWFYNKNPMKDIVPDGLPMVGLKSQGTIVGILTYHPVVFRVGDANQLGCWMIAWFVDEEFRSLGIALLMWLKKRYPIIAAMGFNADVAPLYTQAGFNTCEALYRPVMFVDTDACLDLIENPAEVPNRLVEALKFDSPGEVVGVKAQPVSHYSLIHEELWDKVRPFYPIGTNRSAEYLRWRYEDNPFIDYTGIEFWVESTLVGLLVLRIEQVRARQEKVGRIVEWICQPEQDEAISSALFSVLNTQKCAFADFFSPSKEFQGRLLKVGFHSEKEYRSLSLPRLFQPLEYRGRQSINCALWIDDSSTLTNWGDLESWYISKSDSNQDDPTPLDYPRRTRM